MKWSNVAKLFSVMIVVIISFLSPRGFGSDVSPELRDLLEEAEANNPEIQSLRYQVDVFQARIPQVSFLEDPEVGFQATNVPWSDFSFNASRSEERRVGKECRSRWS